MLTDYSRPPQYALPIWLTVAAGLWVLGTLAAVLFSRYQIAFAGFAGVGLFNLGVFIIVRRSRRALRARRGPPSTL
jgi:hypothetical protein